MSIHAGIMAFSFVTENELFKAYTEFSKVCPDLNWVTIFYEEGFSK